MKNIIEKIIEWFAELGKFPNTIQSVMNFWIVIVVSAFLIFSILLLIKLIRKHKHNKRHPKIIVIKEEIKLPKKEHNPIKESKKEEKLPRDSKGRFIKRK